MRAFSLPQSNNFLFNQPEVNLQALASQYFNMFNANNIPSTLLNKRPNPAMDGPIQDNLQKKLKTTTLVSHPQQAFSVQNLSNILFSQNQQNQDSFDQLDLIRLQRLQNFSALLNNKEQKQTGPQGFVNKKNEGFHLFNHKVEKIEKVQPMVVEKNFVKEEYIQPEDLTTAHGSPLSNVCKRSADTASETSEDKEEVHNTPSIVDEPELATITKYFPEWDLATIFNFLKSDKPIAEFEKERLNKLERKRGRKAAAKKPKAQAKVSNNKTRKIAL